VWAVVAEAVPPEQSGPVAASLLDPLLQQLAAAMAAVPPPPPGPGVHPTPPPPGGALEPNPILDVLACVFGARLPPGLQAELLSRAWPLLGGALSRYAGDSRGLERVCRTLRYALKAAGKAAAGLLPPLLEALPGLFEATHHPALLFVVSQLVKTFGEDPAYDGAIGALLGRSLLAACGALPSLERMGEDPDLVDDVYLLAERTCVALLPRRRGALGFLFVYCWGREGGGKG